MTTSNPWFRLADPAHEHDWQYFAPATVGAKGVEQCKGCGLYRDPDPERGLVIDAPHGGGLVVPSGRPGSAATSGATASRRAST